MLPIAFHVEIPTYDNGIWTTSIYNDLEEFRTFIKSCFKEPGLYGFDETSFLFNEQARAFRRPRQRNQVHVLGVEPGGENSHRHQGADALGLEVADDAVAVGVVRLAENRFAGDAMAAQRLARAA